MIVRKFVTQLRQLWLCRAEYLWLERQHATIAETLAAPLPTTLGAHHLALLRNLRVRWLTVESGAPGLRQFLPFGKDRSTLKIGFGIIACRDEKLLARTLVETGLLLPFFCTNALLPAGSYAVPAEMREYFSDPQTGVSADGMFEFREEHAILLRHSCWRTDMFDPPEWPLPGIDGKRPYGDCSYFQIDMATLLGQPYPISTDGEVQTDALRDAQLESLHRQMLSALQVFLLHARLDDHV